MEKIQFTHSSGEIHESFNLTKEQAHRLESVIVFESIVARSIISRDYSGDEKSAPRVLRTKTGVLSRSLQHANTEMERLFITLMFTPRADAANTILAALEAFEQASNDYALRSKLIEAAKDHFGDAMSEEKIERHLEDMMNKQARPLKPFKKLVRQVENANYDFQLFKAVIDDEESSAYVMETVEDALHTLKRLKDEGLFNSSQDED
jgi:hypothetical protein